MSKWGVRMEFSEAELRKVLDVSSKELVRRLQHGDADPDLANVLRKAARALSAKQQRELREVRQ